jgi:hypothetical protein
MSLIALIGAADEGSAPKSSVESIVAGLGGIGD